MYTNDPGGLIALLLFYVASLLSVCCCVIALILVYNFQTAAAILSIGGILGSIISGLLFVSLLPTKALPNRYGLVTLAVFIFFSNHIVVFISTLQKVILLP